MLTDEPYLQEKSLKYHLRCHVSHGLQSFLPSLDETHTDQGCGENSPDGLDLSEVLVN